MVDLSSHPHMTKGNSRLQLMKQPGQSEEQHTVKTASTQYHAQLETR